MDLMIGLLLAMLIFGVYFLPGFAASDRGHPNRTAIFILNLLLGWTLLGWVIALVWAYTGEKRPKETSHARDMRPCPYCAESILRAAKVCRFCQRDVVTAERDCHTTTVLGAEDETHPCRDCGTTVSTSSTHCHRCGAVRRYPMKGQKKFPLSGKV